MNKLQLPEILILLLVVLVFINLVIISIKRLITSKIPLNQKIGWFFTMFIFQILGFIVFLIYHDYYLDSALRGK